jgi:hypothetical protein
MKTINETYEIALKDKKVEVIHTGFKALKDQENVNEVQECIQDSILNNKKTLNAQ